VKKVEEIRSRIRHPKNFIKRSMHEIVLDEEKGIKAVIGEQKGYEGIKVQVVIFDRQKGWNLYDAKNWIKEHKNSLKSNVIVNYSLGSL
jgi:hypothetical protein